MSVSPQFPTLGTHRQVTQVTDNCIPSLPSSQELSTDHSDLPSYDFRLDAEEVAYLSTLDDTLPLDFLQSPLPDGIGFSSNVENG